MVVGGVETFDIADGGLALMIGKGVLGEVVGEGEIGLRPAFEFFKGFVGLFVVVAGLVFVNKIGAGPFAGLLITANILMSLVIDKFGWFGMDVHPLNGWRMLGAALMVGGIALIARF